MRKKIIITILAVVAVILVYLLANYGRLQITTQNNQSTVQIVLTDDKNNKTEYSTETTENSYTLRRGTYTAVITENDKSYFANISIPGFFQQVTVTATLSEPKSRNFIADNPYSCTYPVGDVVFSSPCGSLLSNLSFHKPATDTNPTFTQKVTVPTDGYIEGYIERNNQHYLVVKIISSNIHALYKLSGDGTITYTDDISSLKPTRNYFIKDYDGSFMAYDNYYGEVVTIPDNDRITNYSVESTLNDTPLKEVDVNDDRQLYVYSNDPHTIGDFYNAGDVGVHAEDINEASEQTDIVQVMQGEKIYKGRRDTIKKASFCGEYLCLLNDTGLEIVNYAKNFKTIQSIQGVTNYTQHRENLMLTLGDKVVAYDTEQAGGSVTYTTPSDYVMCGSISQADNFYICIQSPDGKRSVLTHNLKKNDITQIDQRIADLRDREIISSVSVQGRYVYVSPDYGEASYQEDIQTYGYSTQQINSVNAQFKQLLNDTGLRKMGFTIKTNL